MFAPMKTASSTATDELVSVAKAAELLGVARRTAYYLVQSEAIPSVQYPTRSGKKAGPIRVRLSEIQKFLKASERA